MWRTNQRGVRELHSRGNIDAYVLEKGGLWHGFVDDHRPVMEADTFPTEKEAKDWCRKTVLERRKPSGNPRRAA